MTHIESLNEGDNPQLALLDGPSQAEVDLAREKKRNAARRRQWLQKIYPLIEDGGLVEYFSSSHGQWIPGVMQLSFMRMEALDEGEDLAQPHELLVYNALLRGTHQVRNDVPIDSVRPQFQNGELVDVFSMRNGGTWLQGHISARQSRSRSLTGYRVILEGTNQEFSAVPPSRLRRRFVAGANVEIYRGPDQGWIPAVVQSAEEAGRVESPDVPEPLGASSPGSGGLSQQIRDARAFPWVMVPVIPEETHMYTPTDLPGEWLPSYLVRGCAILSHMKVLDQPKTSEKTTLMGGQALRQPRNSSRVVAVESTTLSVSCPT